MAVVRRGADECAHVVPRGDERLRDEQRFPSVEALRAQIADDVARAKAMLAGVPM